MDLDPRQRLQQLRRDCQSLDVSVRAGTADEESAVAEMRRLARRFSAILQTLQNQEDPERS